MSGWGFDSSALGQFARSAISSATKQIDKVLDIDDSQDPTAKDKSFASSSLKPAVRADAKSSAGDQSKGSFWDTWDSKLGATASSGGDGGENKDWSSASLNSSSWSKSEPAVVSSAPSRKSHSSSRSPRGSSSLKSPEKSPPFELEPDNSSSATVAESTPRGGNEVDSSSSVAANAVSTAAEGKAGARTSASRGMAKKSGGRSRRASQNREQENAAAQSSPKAVSDENRDVATQSAEITAVVSDVPSTENNACVDSSLVEGQHAVNSSEPEPQASPANLPLSGEAVCSVGVSSPVLEAVSASPPAVEQAALPTAVDMNKSSPPNSNNGQTAKQRKSKAMALRSSKGKSASRGKSTAAATADECQVDESPNQASQVLEASGTQNAPGHLEAESIGKPSDTAVSLPDSSTPLKAPVEAKSVPDVSPISTSPDLQPKSSAGSLVIPAPSDIPAGEEAGENCGLMNQGSSVAAPSSTDAAEDSMADDGWGESNWDELPADAAVPDAAPASHATSITPNDPISLGADPHAEPVSHNLLSSEPTEVEPSESASSPPIAKDNRVVVEQAAPVSSSCLPSNSMPAADPSGDAASLPPDTTLVPHAQNLAETGIASSDPVSPPPAVVSPSVAEAPQPDAAVDPPPPTQADDELAQCRHVLGVREDKILELSRANIDLQETNAILRNQLEQMERLQEEESADVDRVTAEFTERLAEMERRHQKKCRECDQLRGECEALSAGGSESRSHYERMLKEKEDSIEGLMAEGEKLSKQQLQQSNTIKKIRAKEKELDQQVSALRHELEDTRKTLKKTQNEKRETEETAAKIQDSLMKVNSVAEKQTKELAVVKSSLEDEEEKARGLQSALDNVYKELAALQKEKASNQSAAQEAALEAEVQARRELKQELEKCKNESLAQQEALLLQISDLRATITRTEQLASRREDHLKQEIADLHSRLQEAEGHSQELTNSVSGATRPLLRQIENLQSSHNAQAVAWEKLERNLTERLTDAQNQLAEVSEHDRLMSERVSELQTRLSTLESSSTSSRQDKARLSAELELLRSRFETIEEDRATAVAKLEALRNSYHQEMEGLRREKLSLTQQLENEKTSATAERKRAAIAEEHLEKERQRHQKVLSDLRDSQPTPASTASTPSVGSHSLVLPNQGDILEESLHGRSQARLSLDSPDGLGDASFRGLPLAIGMEHLQSSLKQREGEVSALQSQVALLEKARSSVSDQLVSVATENEQLQQKLEQVPALKRQVDDLDKRYNTMLQMYGEKAEEANELRMDLEDVKSMYKQQIQDLLTRGMH